MPAFSSDWSANGSRDQCQHMNCSARSSCYESRACAKLCKFEPKAIAATTWVPSACCLNVTGPNPCWKKMYTACSWRSDRFTGRSSLSVILRVVFTFCCFLFLDRRCPFEMLVQCFHSWVLLRYAQLLETVVPKEYIIHRAIRNFCTRNPNRKKKSCLSFTL